MLFEMEYMGYEMNLVARICHSAEVKLVERGDVIQHSNSEQLALSEESLLNVQSGSHSLP
jgi:hypothetical protein